MHFHYFYAACYFARPPPKNGLPCFLLLPSPIPPPPFSGAVALLFGGIGGSTASPLSDLWEYRRGPDIWTQLHAGGGGGGTAAFGPAPPGRSGHSAVYIKGVL